MTIQAGSFAAHAGSRRVRWPAERRFYLAFTAAIIAAVLLGFARTFLFRPWFPDFHGILFVGWLLLLLVVVVGTIASLMAAGRPTGFVNIPLPPLQLVPLLVWDLASRGRLHPVTLWGGMVVIAA